MEYRYGSNTVEISIIKDVVSKDHMHIFVSEPPTMAPSEIMRRIKGRSLSKLFAEFPQIKKRYWGRHFCATSGQVSDEMIQNYIKHHFEPNKNDNFKTEG